MSKFLAGIELGEDLFLVELDGEKIASVTPVTKLPPDVPLMSGGSSNNQTDNNSRQIRPTPSQQEGVSVVLGAALVTVEPQQAPQAGNEQGEGSQEFELASSRIDSAFRQRLQSIMTDNKYDRHLKGRKKGKIDHRALWRAQTGVNNVFSQKLARKNKDYSIVLIIDQSGSMQDAYIPANVKNELLAMRSISPSEYLSRYNKVKRQHSLQSYASAVVLFLLNHFEKLNIELAVIGFGTDSLIHKTFEQDIADQQQKDILVGKLKMNLGGTYLPSALSNAYQLLKHKRNGLVIIISDGDTGGKEVVERLVRANRLTPTFGIGLMGLKISCIPKSVTVNNIEQLKPEVIKYLRKHIKRGA